MTAQSTSPCFVAANPSPNRHSIDCSNFRSFTNPLADSKGPSFTSMAMTFLATPASIQATAKYP